jgi:mediator of RNA polymerase II transcription subunit 17
MSHARDLLTLLLSSKTPSQAQDPFPEAAASSSPSTSSLTATIVTKPPPITSVQAFNAQVVIGGKDQALRQTADLFRAAVEAMERGHVKGERYWVDALKIRRGNWGLIPAPLPFGSASWKGADKTSKDFLVSFGLEECK